MNEEIRCITNKGKPAKNAWDNDDCNILRTLYSAYKKIRTIAFPYLLVTLFKQEYFSSVKSYKYFNKFIS